MLCYLCTRFQTEAFTEVVLVWRQKKVLKKDAKKFGSEGIDYISLHPLSPQNGVIATSKRKEFLKILEGLKQTASASPMN